MKSFLLKLTLPFAICCATALNSYSQMKLGNNPANMNSNSILEMESTNKGVLLPRVALSATNNASPLTAFISGMAVYNTAFSGSGTTLVTPGIYYSDGTSWVRAVSSAAGAGTGIQRVEYTATQGQLTFITPSIITDINKVFLYRNGVLINCTPANSNAITSEIACDANDNIKIIQQQ
jgi:hypothetical protein